VIGDIPVTPIPEPATFLYLGAALAALAVHRRIGGELG